MAKGLRSPAERHVRRESDEGSSAPRSCSLPPRKPTDRDRSRGSVEKHGAMGCVDSNGADCFNFPQTVWLYPGIPMRATPHYSRAAEVLAVNILSLVLEERDYRAAQGRTSSRAVKLARTFWDDCLAELPSGPWCIPLETIRDWIEVSGHQA